MYCVSRTIDKTIPIIIQRFRHENQIEGSETNKQVHAIGLKSLGLTPSRHIDATLRTGLKQ